jgi:hypothetical protein
MAHDHNGRVGPPRCEECNAPLNSDDRRSASVFARPLCFDCHRERNPFPVIKRKRGRPSRELRVRSSEPSIFGTAILNLDVETVNGIS